MKLSDIQQELCRLFDEQNSAAGAVVVWHDPDGAFAESLDALDLPGVEVMREEERELFSLKRTLNADLAGRRILLYRPRARRLEGDWLADIEARSASFAADYTSMQLRELNAADTREMREALAAHKAQLAKKTVLRKLTRLSPSYEQPQQLACGLMAIAPGRAIPGRAGHRARVPRRGIGRRWRRGTRQGRDMGCADEFRAAIAAWVGFTGDASDFIALGRHVLLGALASALPSGAAPMPPSDATLGNAAVCQGIVRSWCQSSERGSLFELAQIVEVVANIEQMLAQVPLDALGDTDVFPCIDALILRRLFRDIATAPETAAGALALAQVRHNTAWYREFSLCYAGLEAAARMQRYRNEHPDGIDALPRRARLGALHRRVAPHRHVVPPDAPRARTCAHQRAVRTRRGLPRMQRTGRESLQELVPRRRVPPLGGRSRGRVVAQRLCRRHPASARLLHGLRRARRARGQARLRHHLRRPALRSRRGAGGDARAKHEGLMRARLHAGHIPQRHLVRHGVPAALRESHHGHERARATARGA